MALELEPGGSEAGWSARVTSSQPTSRMCSGPSR
eukprot:CAMPEP_0196692744 /NCGR_PEP_ID=MMETSP1090-20130531/28424_1 /TAXON_ID=37098 /ORGANISM="Isochrysis sp, Strain CCMP1244" /LENGTH=33 /DNA_ID= /DNA_START= /DNA_END= /DNA_ORIENTATION=